MKKKAIIIQNVPYFVPYVAVNYTEAKLYIPTEIKNGKKVPSLKKAWYIWFRYRNPKTGIMDGSCKFNNKGGINKYKTVAQRKKAGLTVVKAYNDLLAKGYNPYENTLSPKLNISFELENNSIITAINKAIESKKTTWATSTAEGIIFRVNKFIDFAVKYGFSTIPTSHLNRKHVVEFLKTIKQKETATSVNNYRAALSSVFAQMVQNNDIEYNFVKDIRKEKANPIKNHPFTNNQITEIKNYLQEVDPYLLQFIRVLAYSFLRNREVIRLQVKDIDLNNNIFSIKTKTKALDRVYITDQLRDIFLPMALNKYDGKDFIFTPAGTPGKWDAPEKTKTDHFSFRFRKVKKKFNLGSEYGIYSFRHSFALNVFNNFLEQGISEAEAMAKMLPITRHDSVDGLRNYLREKKKMLPKDYSHNITIDF